LLHTEKIIDCKTPNAEEKKRRKKSFVGSTLGPKNNIVMAAFIFLSI